MSRKNYCQKPSKHINFRLSPIYICQNKKSYNSKSEAEQSINYQMRLNPDIQLKTYYCPDCQKWHLTTKNTF